MKQYKRETKTRRITLKITEENLLKIKKICLEKNMTQQQLFDETLKELLKA